LASSVDSPWTAVTLIGLAGAGQAGFSSNLFTLTSDLFPEKVVGSVVGFGGMFGAIGGILMAQTAGRVVHATGSYGALFLAVPLAYLFAIGMIHLLSPRLEPLKVSDLTERSRLRARGGT
jgi:ACS family hexuronate transporter-like MFS transporter